MCVCVCVCVCVCFQVCPTLSDPVDCSPPGSYVHGTFQARILKWVSKEPACPTIKAHLSCISRQILFHCYTLYETELAASSQLLSWHCSTGKSFPCRKRKSSMSDQLFPSLLGTTQKLYFCFISFKD